MTELSSEAVGVFGRHQHGKATNAFPCQRPRIWRIALVVLFLTAVYGSGMPRGVATAAPVPPLSARSADTSRLTQELDALLADEPGVYGVVVMAADGRVLYSRNRDVPFIAASLFKLVVMASVYELEASGKLTLNEALPGWGTVGDALSAMIVHSDNGSTQALIDHVGGIGVVNETAARLGLDHTRLDVDAAWVQNLAWESGGDSAEDASRQGIDFVAANAATGSIDVTTPADTARFFRLLLQGRVVNQEASKEMLDLLAKQQINDRLPVLLPAGTTVAHKTGNLPSVIHDAGIITTPAGPVIVAALSEAMPAEDRAFQVIQELGLIVYESVEPPPRGGRERLGL